MITLLVAWIDGKYKCDFTVLYFGTVIIDIVLICAISEFAGS